MLRSLYPQCVNKSLPRIHTNSPVMHKNTAREGIVSLALKAPKYVPQRTKLVLGTLYDVVDGEI